MAAAVIQNPSVADARMMTTGTKIAEHAVGEALHLGLAGLSVLDHPADLRQCGVGADPRGAHDEPASDVHGCAGDGVAGSHLDGHGLAGQQ